MRGRMTLLRKLIDYYETHIKAVAEMTCSIKKIHLYLNDHYLDCGICYVSISVFNVNIYYDNWVEKVPTNSQGSSFWTYPVEYADSKKEALELMQYRVDIMKKILKNPKSLWKKN